MKKYISISLLIVCSFFLTNCSEDSFSTVVEVDLSEYGNQMVVSAPFQPEFPTPEFSRFFVSLEKSNEILDESSDFEKINNATVDIYEEGTFWATLSRVGEGYYASELGTGPQLGKSYQIEISSPEYGKVTASSYVPNPIKIKNAFVSDENYFDVSEGREKIEVTFEIEDESNVENYYSLTVNSMYEQDGGDNSSFWNACFSTSDPVFDEDEFNDDFFEVEESPTTYYCGGLSTFRDLIFEGQTKTVKIYIDQYDAYTYTYDPITGAEERVRRDIQLVFGAMSRDIYNYKRSARSQSWNGDNPFAEPVRVYSNIEGGIGIFGGFVETAVILE